MWLGFRMRAIGGHGSRQTEWSKSQQDLPDSKPFSRGARRENLGKSGQIWYSFALSSITSDINLTTFTATQGFYDKRKYHVA
jgi:hypothetical protein